MAITKLEKLEPEIADVCGHPRKRVRRHLSAVGGQHRVLAEDARGNRIRDLRIDLGVGFRKYGAEISLGNIFPTEGTQAL